MSILLYFFQAESFVPILLQRKASQIRFETKNWAIHSKLDERKFDLSKFSFFLLCTAWHLRKENILTTYFLRPFEMLAYEPMLLLLTIYTAFVYGILYLLFSAVSIRLYHVKSLNPS